MPVGELHHAHRLPVALRVGHAELPLRPLLRVAALLVTDQGHRPAVQLADPVTTRRRRPGRGRRGARTSRRGSARRSRACTAGPRAARARPGPDLLVGRLASIRSSWRCRRSSSPERRAPRRSIEAAELAEPLRSRISHLGRPSPLRRAGGDDQRRPQLGARDDRVDVPEARFDSARPKSSGSFSRVVCATTRGPANDIARPARRGGRRRGWRSSRAGHRWSDGPSPDRARSPPRAAPRRRRRSSAAASARGSPPACARRRTRRRRSADARAAALSQARANFSPDDASHRAAHEREVHHRELARAILDRGARRSTIASPSPVATSASRAARVRPQVEEAERVGRPQVGRLLDEAALVGELRRSARAPAPGSGGRTAGRRAGSRQLVVAIVRAAAGQVFGCFFGGGGSGACLCSIETSILRFRHRDLRPGPSGHGYRPRAAAQRRRAASLVPGVGRGREAGPATRCATAIAEQRLGLAEPKPVRLGHEDGQLTGSTTSRSSAT